MFTLTETEARLTLYSHANLSSYSEADTLLYSTRQNSDSSVELPKAKCKLFYDDKSDRFYLDSSQVYNYGKLYIFESLELLESYWEYLTEICDFARDYIEYLKLGYSKYKADNTL